MQSLGSSTGRRRQAREWTERVPAATPTPMWGSCQSRIDPARTSALNSHCRESSPQKPSSHATMPTATVQRGASCTAAHTQEGMSGRFSQSLADSGTSSPGFRPPSQHTARAEELSTRRAETSHARPVSQRTPPYQPVAVVVDQVANFGLVTRGRRRVTLGRIDHVKPQVHMCDKAHIFG